MSFKNYNRKFFSAGILIILLFLCFFLYLSTPIIIGSKPLCLIVKPGESFELFSEDLSAHSRLTFPIWFRWYAKLTGKSRHLKLGEYCFLPGSNARQILDKVLHGKVVVHSFTIVDGWTFDRLKRALQSDPILRHTIDKYTMPQLLKHFNLERDNLEGEFYPATYYYTYPDTDMKILEQAHHLLGHRLNQLWLKRDEKIPYKSPYEALIAASIIQKESSNSEGRHLISGVIVNRLAIHMRLQMDPTVIYGSGIQGRALTHSDLKKDTKYNTYLHWGLPPTPICMASESSIEAALHPTSSKYLYFVANGKGHHVFSISLDDQRANIRTYLMNQKGNKDHNE